MTTKPQPSDRCATCQHTRRSHLQGAGCTVSLHHGKLCTCTLFRNSPLLPDAAPQEAGPKKENTK
jgi:hypothetical protein